MQVKFRMLKGRFRTWQSLLEEAAEFASTIGRERLINVSQCEDSGLGVVTVWYWSETPAAAGDEQGKECR